MLDRAIDRWAPRIVSGMLAAMGNPPLRVVLWDGRAVGASPEEAVGGLRLLDRGAFLRFVYDPELQVGDLYTEGRLEFEGHPVGLLETAFRSGYDVGVASRLVPRWLLRGALRQDLASSQRNAQHHYDVGNEFYALWLDERMVYTCAYFSTPGATLEDAQVAKMDHVCRKVGLAPGQRVIEAGCGWGSLAIHMARRYGVEVRAFNVSREQILYAREQAEKQGVRDRVEFIEDDYRNASGRCDRFVSVGMLEHVGRDHYTELGDVIERCLEPDGTGLVHTIGRTRPLRLNRWIEKRVFPNAYTPTLREMMDIFEPRNFAVLDVENLRRHYALTGRHWYERFCASRRRVDELVGERIGRTWHLYLAGTVAAFETASLCLFQVVFSRAGNDHIPWTRVHQYTGDPVDYGA